MTFRINAGENDLYLIVTAFIFEKSRTLSLSSSSSQ